MKRFLKLAIFGLLALASVAWCPWLFDRGFLAKKKSGTTIPPLDQTCTNCVGGQPAVIIINSVDWLWPQYNGHADGVYPWSACEGGGWVWRDIQAERTIDVLETETGYQIWTYGELFEGRYTNALSCTSSNFVGSTHLHWQMYPLEGQSNECDAIFGSPDIYVVSGMSNTWVRGLVLTDGVNYLYDAAGSICWSESGGCRGFPNGNDDFFCALGGGEKGCPYTNGAPYSLVGRRISADLTTTNYIQMGNSGSLTGAGDQLDMIFNDTCNGWGDNGTINVYYNGEFDVWIRPSP